MIVLYIIAAPPVALSNLRHKMPGLTLTRIKTSASAGAWRIDMCCEAGAGIQAGGYKAVTHHQIEALSFLGFAAGHGAQSDGFL
jgi:hypothetical protein